MSVISNLPAMPNRIAIACEYLFTLLPDGSGRDEIIKQLSPMKRDEGNEGQGGTTIAAAVLSEMENLQLVRVSGGGKLTLIEDLAQRASEDTDWKLFLRPLLRNRLTTPDIAAECKQPDVPDALAWLLTQDPFNPLAKSAVQANRINQQLGAHDELRTVVGNDARFQNLLYWARYLGFAEWIGVASSDQIVADPTRAIAADLPAIFAVEARLTVSAFAQRVAANCPVLDGGSARLALERRMVERPQLEGHFSRATSLALVRLEARGLISLTAESDAETWALDLGRARRPVSSVSCGAEKQV
jgi:hypothetical protein